MTMTDLQKTADELLARAAESPAHRAAHTVHGGSEHALRQTLIALVAGATLDEHENPGEATLHVLRGQVELHSGGSSTTLGEGQLAPIPPARHSLTADRDSVLLLTVVKG
ncbi:MAG TPA: cupin domain-containing protein [Mycobacteriales bacterium]|nr:cupin domain-containing protein [Mycobacteriales bacterium]